MTDAQNAKQARMVRLVVTLSVLALVLGAIWYGFSQDVYKRVWTHLVERVGGPMTFRVILQPAVSIVAAVKDGMMDARLGRDPYLYSLLTNRDTRHERLSEGLASTSTVFILAFVIDIVYQYVVFKTFFPGEAVVVAISLALIPYFLLRGPVKRLAARRMAKS